MFRWSRQTPFEQNRKPSQVAEGLSSHPDFMSTRVVLRLFRVGIGWMKLVANLLLQGYDRGTSTAKWHHSCQPSQSVNRMRPFSQGGNDE